MVPMDRNRRWLLWLVLAACAPRTEPAAEPTSRPAARPAFTWPIPSGWRGETIRFPLGFAPELPYRGVEELRFAPGFFDAAAPGFWSYAFVWSLEGDPPLTLPQLQADLRVYFVGLARAVAEGKFETHPEGVTVELSEVPGAEPGLTTFAGTLRVFDAFTTRRELGLAVEGRVFACGDRRVLLLAASPQPADDALWLDLRACMATFRCE